MGKSVGSFVIAGAKVPAIKGSVVTGHVIDQRSPGASHRNTHSQLTSTSNVLCAIYILLGN